MKDLYILTSKDLYPCQSDDKGLIECFQKHDINAIPVVWDEFSVEQPINVLLRTPWDYARKSKEFLVFLQSVYRQRGQTINSLSTVQWNLDKSYMLELQQLGVHCIPTNIVKDFSVQKLYKELERTQLPLVIKPLIGAGGINTFLLKQESDIELARDLENQDVIVQPFIASVQTTGEYSYMFFGDEFSHAVLKCPEQGEFRVQDKHGGTVVSYLPSSKELDQVYELLAKVGRSFAYARVDVVEYSGRLALIELEVIEPELFFRFSPPAMDLFCTKIAKNL